MSVTIVKTSPGVTVQDLGRAGGMGLGLSRGGAVDRWAFLDGIALLGNVLDSAGLEVAGLGPTLRFGTDTRIALTGARMRAQLDGRPLPMLCVVSVSAGQTLRILAVEAGTYGYVHFAGGLATETELGGRGRHGIAGLGPVLFEGQELALGPAQDTPLRSLPEARKPNGPIRVMPGPQTELFSPETRAAFEVAELKRSAMGNRQGVRLDGPTFSTRAQLTLASDFISEGDIQLTGDGSPFVLLADCQTMGGYPRLGTVLPVDLPRVAQAMPSDALRFAFVSLEEAEAAWLDPCDYLEKRAQALQPLVRDPYEIDLLSLDLIDRPPPDVVG